MEKDLEKIIDAKEEETSPCCDAEVSNGRCKDCGDNFK